MSDIPEAFVCHIDHPKYALSVDGLVISFVKKTPLLMKGGMQGDYRGFQMLNRDGELVHRKHHRLVAECFQGASPAGMEVRHLDGNRFNNHPDNLRWGTRSQNMRDKDHHGTSPVGERHPMAKLDEQRVVMIRKLYKWRQHIPVKSVLKYFGISRMNHHRIVNRQLWKHVP